MQNYFLQLWPRLAAKSSFLVEAQNKQNLWLEKWDGPSGAVHQQTKPEKTWANACLLERHITTANVWQDQEQFTHFCQII